MAKYQARIAADHLLGRDTRRARRRRPARPRVIFTDPQVAAVGHTHETAAEAGLRRRVVDVPTSGNAGGSFYGRGARARRASWRRGARRAESAPRSQAPRWPTSSTRPRSPSSARCRSRGCATHAVPAFPTRSEIWLKLLEAVDGAAEGL
jgi:dihydrolipoamide dehydrogenase